MLNTETIAASTLDLDNAETHQHLIMALTNLYTQPVRSVIREYLANAYDARLRYLTQHSDAPVCTIITPTKKNPQLIISNPGGMSTQELFDRLLNYGNSDKRNEAFSSGSKGFGGKIGTILAGMVSFKTAKDGVLSVGHLINNDNIISHVLEEATTTNDDDFTEVTVQVNPAADMGDFEKVAQQVAFSFPPKSFRDALNQEFYPSYKDTYHPVTDRFYIGELNDGTNLNCGFTFQRYNNTYCPDKHLTVVVAGVAYPYTLKDDSIQETLRNIHYWDIEHRTLSDIFGYNRYEAILEIDPNLLDIPPARESLTQNAHNEKIITEALAAEYQKLADADTSDFVLEHRNGELFFSKDRILDYQKRLAASNTEDQLKLLFHPRFPRLIRKSNYATIIEGDDRVEFESFGNVGAIYMDSLDEKATYADYFIYDHDKSWTAGVPSARNEITQGAKTILVYTDKKPSKSLIAKTKQLINRQLLGNTEAIIFTHAWNDAYKEKALIQFPYTRKEDYTEIITMDEFIRKINDTHRTMCANQTTKSSAQRSIVVIDHGQMVQNRTATKDWIMEYLEQNPRTKVAFIQRNDDMTQQKIALHQQKIALHMLSFTHPVLFMSIKIKDVARNRTLSWFTHEQLIDAPYGVIDGIKKISVEVAKNLPDDYFNILWSGSKTSWYNMSSIINHNKFTCYDSLYEWFDALEPIDSKTYRDMHKYINGLRWAAVIGYFDITVFEDMKNIVPKGSHSRVGLKNFESSLRSNPLPIIDNSIVNIVYPAMCGVELADGYYAKNQISKKLLQTLMSVVNSSA